MKYSKDLLVILVVVILAAVCFIALETTLEGENSHVDGRYNYTFSTSTSFVNSDGDTVYAPDGQMYVVADIILMNIDWHNGISDDPSDFELEVNEERIQAAPDTYLYPPHSAPVVYVPGELGHNYYLYIVPIGTDVSDLHIIYTKSNKITYDPELTILVR